MNIQERLRLDTAPVYLMDGTAFIYRSFYSNQHLRRSDGFPTNALAILTRTLLKIMRQERPLYFLFVMDGKEPSFRADVYEKYKANREAMPEDLVVQIEPIKSMVRALGLRLEVTAKVEADDCIASLAARFRDSHPVVIISGDKDLKQCLAPDVIMWDPKDEKITTLESFEEESGVTPAQWPDMQALIGDSSDNIPGVPGIGPKTARLIFEKCKSLEDIKKNIDQLAPKLQAKLRDHLDEMFKWRELTTLKRDACPNITLEDLRPRGINVEECGQIAREYQMGHVRAEIISLAEAEKEEPAPGRQAGLLEPEKAAPPAPAWPAAEEINDAALLPDCAGLSCALIWLKGEKGPRLAVGEIPEISEGMPPPVCQPVAEYLWTGSQADLCAWLSGAASVIVHDLKSLLTGFPSWAKLGASLKKSAFTDLSLAAYLLNPEEGNYEWERLGASWREPLKGENSGPAALALAMAAALLRNLLANSQLALYRELEMPLIWVLAGMQEIGVEINPAAFQDFLRDVQTRLDELTDRAFEEAGEKFNIRSAQQLGEILFEKMKIPGGKRTKSGQFSTSVASLEKLAPKYPLVETVLELRKLEKMRSTYLDPLPRLMDSDHRLHTTFNQEATATGRLSSSNPNLQNIPVRGPLGERMRACFTAAPGRFLISCDYSQIELRILADLSGDKHLLNAFHNGADIHKATAALIFELDASQVGADQRRMAKTINFGLLYGMGAQHLARDLKISVPEAKDFMAKYFSKLGRLKSFYEKILEGARENGYVTTIAGRRRWLPGIYSSNGQIAAAAQRQAVNTVIQGSAADVIKLAMLAVSADPELEKMKARLLLQIHDELLLEAPRDNAKAACARVIGLMEGARPGGHAFSVPMLVDGGVGENWAQAH